MIVFRVRKYIPTYDSDLVTGYKRLAMAKVNTAVHVKEFLEMRQDAEVFPREAVQ